MMNKYKLIGKLAVPVADLLEWAQWMETADRVVARTHIEEMVVSTVFLGIDHNFFGSGDPLLFETMVFGSQPEFYDEGWSARSSTWREAAASHAEGIRWAENVLSKAKAILDDG